MCWYHASSSPPYPPLADVRLLSKTEKKHREIERFWDNVLVSCKQFSTLPPLQMSGSCPKTEKTSRNRKILSKTKKNLEKSKKTKKTKDSGTMCWYHVNILLARLVFLVFFDFSRFLSVLDKIFRFLDVFFDFGWFLSNSQCFFDFGHLLLISRCF